MFSYFFPSNLFYYQKRWITYLRHYLIHHCSLFPILWSSPPHPIHLYIHNSNLHGNLSDTVHCHYTAWDSLQLCNVFHSIPSHINRSRFYTVHAAGISGHILCFGIASLTIPVHIHIACFHTVRVRHSLNYKAGRSNLFPSILHHTCMTVFSYLSGHELSILASTAWLSDLPRCIRAPATPFCKYTLLICRIHDQNTWDQGSRLER